MFDPFLSFHDSTFLPILAALALALYAQWKVRSTFARYSEQRSGSGYTGAQVAAARVERPLPCQPVGRAPRGGRA